MRGNYASPQVVENNAIEERVGADNAAVSHVPKPRVRVDVRFAVRRNASRIEENDDRITYRVDLANRGL